MYKTMLQELCHRRRWCLPEYTVAKEGPDHMPSFKSSVVVNGVTFTSPHSFSSSKQAHNQAAMLAFRSFSSSPLGSSTPTSEYDTQKDISIPAQSSFLSDKDHRLSKSQLLNYAQRNQLDPPVYHTSKSEGPSHAPRFKATVLVGGQSFESPAFSNTIKQAEQAAAKFAFMSLSLDTTDYKCDCGPFKTLLMELTQREGFCEPVYDTVQCGCPHDPTFFTTLKVEGMEFHGKASRSKKHAEQDVAKIAYIALKECGIDMFAAFSSSNIKENKAAQSIHGSDILKSKQYLKH